MTVSSICVSASASVTLLSVVTLPDDIDMFWEREVLGARVVTAMLEGAELCVRSCSELRARELLLEGGVVNGKAPPISTPAPAHGGGNRS